VIRPLRPGLFHAEPPHFISDNGYDKKRHVEGTHDTAGPDCKAAPRAPPKPDGPTPQVEVQRAYRAQLKAAGKVVRLVDARVAAGIPDFDPAKDGIFERQMVESMRDRLHDALSKLKLREEDVSRLGDRNAYLEAELKAQERGLTNALKDNILLKQQLARARARRQ